MDKATNIEGTVSVNGDGSWSYTWGWTYLGPNDIDGVHEEIAISRPNGSVIDFKREEPHLAAPGQSYIGGGFGNQTVPPGQMRWTLTVLCGGTVLGMAGGHFFAETAPG